MAELTREQAQQLVQSRVSPTNFSPYGDGAYQGTVYPRRVYFYHLKNPNENPPQPVVYDYVHPIKIRNRPAIEQVIERLSRNAVMGLNNPRPEPATGFNSIKWRNVSLICILLDFESWEFDRGSAISFFDENGIRRGNHSFFNADQHEFDVEDGVGSHRVSILYFLNHFVDFYGQTLAPGLEEYFEYELYRDEDGKILSTPIDPGGTNLGPPVPPP